MFPLWLLGCLISLAGSVGAIVGTTIQKLSFRHNDALPLANRRVYWKQKRWLMGLGLVVIGGFTDFASLSMTPQSTIAALGSMPLAANVPLAHYWLHEPVSKRDLVGTALIVLGSTLSVVFGDHSDKTYTSSDLQNLYKEIAYIIYGFCILGCMIIFYVAVRYLTPLRVKLVEAIDAYRVAEAEDQLDEAEAAKRAEEEAATWCLVSPEDVVEAVHANLAPPGLLAQEAVLVKPALESAATAAPEASESALLLHPPTAHNRSSSAGNGSGAGTEVAASSLSSSSNANTPSLGPSSSPLGLTLDSMSFESGGEIGASSSVRGAQRASTSVLSARAAVLDLEISYAPYRRVHPVFFCALSGIFGAQSLLFGKSVASLLATSMTKGDDQFSSPLTYAFILALGACLLGQLHFFATALEFFDALFVVPVFKCFYLMLSTVGGALYFREVQNFDTRQWVFFPLGLVMNIAGVWVLSSRDMKLDQADPTNQAVDAAIAGSGGEDALLAHIHDSSLGASAAFESMRPSASFNSKAGSLLGRSSLEDINIAPQDEIEQAAQQALLSNASENLLRNAVEIANEEAASGPSDHHDRVLLVTSPMAGVTLVASEMIGSPGASSQQPQNSASPPPSLSRQPTQPLAGSRTNGNDSALRTSNSWVSPEPLLAAAHQPSDDGPPALPRSASNVDPHGMLSPGSMYGNSMGVSMFSLPQHGNSLLARSARSPVAASATPYDRRSSVLNPGSAMSYGSLVRTRSSEQQAGSLQPAMGSLARASSVTARSVNLPASSSNVGRRNLPPRVSVPGSRRRSTAGSSAAHPPDILVQRGSLIYRQSSFTGQTPLDSSRMTPAGSRSAASSDANAADAASGPGWGDSIPLYLTPNQASSFSVASPITNEVYSMPRDHSIFAHTRSYLARLGSATGLLRGRTPSAAAAAAASVSPQQPNPYTAPQMRPPPANAAQVHAARGLPFSAGANAVSGGDSYRPNSSAGHLAAEEEQAWREAREHIASTQRRSAAVDVSAAAGGAGAPVPLSSSVAATSYVPPSFLRQPLAQLLPSQPPHTADTEAAEQQTQQPQPPL